MTVRRTRTILAAALCTLGALPGAASAAAHHKAKPKPRAAMDTVKGEGAINQFGVLKARLKIDARSSANATDPAGEVTAETLVGGVPIKFRGAVTCLRVRGNQAVVKYDFAEAEPSILKGGGIEIFLKDGGLGSQDFVGFIVPMDALTWRLAGPSRCDPIVFAPFGVVTGDFKITDS